MYENTYQYAIFSLEIMIIILLLCTVTTLSDLILRSINLNNITRTPISVNTFISTSTVLNRLDKIHIY